MNQAEKYQPPDLPDSRRYSEWKALGRGLDAIPLDTPTVCDGIIVTVTRHDHDRGSIYFDVWPLEANAPIEAHTHFVLEGDCPGSVIVTELWEAEADKPRDVASADHLEVLFESETERLLGLTDDGLTALAEAVDAGRHRSGPPT